MTDWCILTSSAPSRTMALATSLAEAGFDVWTPIEEVKEKGSVKVRAMIAPFLFARSHHLGDLRLLVRSPALNYQVWDSARRRMVTKGHPHFRLFRPLDGYPMVPEAALAHLRVEERRRKPRGLVKVRKVGDSVRILGAGFDGLDGIVIATKGKRATVSFLSTGFIREATVPMSMLLDTPAHVHVNSALTEQAQVARAA